MMLRTYSVFRSWKILYLSLNELPMCSLDTVDSLKVFQGHQSEQDIILVVEIKVFLPKIVLFIHEYVHEPILVFSLC